MFGLSLLAQRDGVPLSLIMDGSREQTMSEFRKKAKEMGCHIKVTEPYSPWQNAAEGAIRELKKGAGRKMARMQAPAKFVGSLFRVGSLFEIPYCFGMF